MKKVKEFLQKGNIIMIALIVAIVSIIGIESYKVTHIELKTQEASVSTIYDKIDTTALVIREEQVIDNSSSNVVVPCLEEGDKVNVGGNVAMRFSDSQSATEYSKYLELTKQLAYYTNLQSQTVGHATDLERVDSDIDQKVLDYAYSLSQNNSEEATSNLNSVLVRRQMMIGEKVDLASKINAINEKMNTSVQPNSFITTDKSGIYSGYTDGFENLVDFSKVETTSLKQFDTYMKNVSKKKDTSNNLGKLVNGYQWYMLAKVKTKDTKGLDVGDFVQVVLKDSSNAILKMEIISGTDTSADKKETLLVLKCNEMDTSLSQLRCEQIEIRKAEYEGFKVPFEAVHVVDNKKGVYVLIASEVKFREVEVVYSDDEFVWIKYDSENSKALHLYDKIIIQGKDLQDGKVYT